MARPKQPPSQSDSRFSPTADRGPRRRASLSNVGGEVSSRGDEAFLHPLRRSLEASDSEQAPLLMHAFHSYPARMHPNIAREAIAQFSGHKRSVILDPFCGSGTTVLEAMRAGWRTLGSDLNPLALDLSRVKGSRRKEDARDRFANAVGEAAEASEARVRGRVDVRAKLSADARSWYEVHVLKEMAGLLEEINKAEQGDDRLAMRMVFSAMAVKFSKQQSDTVREQVTKRIRKGLVTEFFVRKASELLQAWEELETVCPDKTLRPKIVRADVRRLATTLSGDFRADLILTSPPYGGTYDYAEHHALRLEWLGYKSHGFVQGELGARRDLAPPGAEPVQARAKGKQEAKAQFNAADAIALWDRQVAEMLAALGPRLSEEGVAVLLMGDGQVGGQRVPADEQLERLAPAAGLRFVAVASQGRPDYAGGAERNEHLIALEAL